MTGQMTTRTVHSLSFYLAHYLYPAQAVPMLLITLLCVGIVVGAIFGACKYMSVQQQKKTANRVYSPSDNSYFLQLHRNFFLEKFLSLTERFFEMIFSCTFIMLFVAVYFYFDYFQRGKTNSLWNNYNGLLLLLFILIAVLLTNLLDSKVIPLAYVEPGQIGNMRLLGMFYILIVFAVIKFRNGNNNYDDIIMYFVTLVIGRFIGFDATAKGFKEDMIKSMYNLPILGLALLCTGIMALYGFRSGYLIYDNGVVMNLFLANLMLILVIYIVHYLVMRRARQADEEEAPPYYDDRFFDE